MSDNSELEQNSEMNFEPKPLSRQQKTGFVLLLIFGILAFGLGFLQMRNTIYKSFVSKNTEKKTEEKLEIDENTKLQMIDTDHDGINDYEELNFYKTSPYLPDTDSDGIEDKKEIEKGNDPLCPEGKECGSTEYITPTSTQITDTSGLSGLTSGSAYTSLENLTTLGSGEKSVEQLKQIIEIQKIISDPAKMRDLLLSTGKVTPEQLNQLTDEQISEVVGQIFDQKQKDLLLNLTATSTPSTTQKSVGVNTSTKL